MESTFLIEVSGRPKDDMAVERFSKKIHRIMLGVDPDVELSTVNFARLNYRLSWSGVPRDMNKITLARRTIQRIIVKYFENWEYHFKINLKESGDGV